MVYSNAMRPSIPLLFVALIFLSFSCKRTAKKDEAAEIVDRWMGKEIMLDGNFPCNILGYDTISGLCSENLQKDYKILLYVDSAGCFSCGLNLPDWKQLIEEADSLFRGEAGFLFFFQPQNMRDFRKLSRFYRCDRRPG
jgi:hypothetical protein